MESDKHTLYKFLQPEKHIASNAAKRDHLPFSK